jgi:hypothetical protein
MVEQVLNKELLQAVLQQMESVAPTPVEDERRGDRESPDTLSKAEIEVLLADISAARQYADPTSEDRRAGEPPQASTEERTVYIPASPELSN